MSDSASGPDAGRQLGWPNPFSPGTAFAIAVAAGLAVLVLGPLVTPLPSLPERGFHEIYVLLTGRQKAEDLLATVEGQADWENPLWISNSSIDAAVSSDAGEVAQTTGIELSCHSVAEVIGNAAEYQGFPIELVGWVSSQPSTVSTEGSAPIAHELTVEGPTRGYRVFVGLPPSRLPTPNFFPWQLDEIIVIRGLVVAEGVDRLLNGEAIYGAYVVGQTIANAESDPSTCVKSLVTSIRKPR